MYFLHTPLSRVRGIGPTLQEKLHEHHLHSVLDLLLAVPLRYEDRSKLMPVSELVENELATIRTVVKSCKTFYKNRRSITTAQVYDESGKLKLMWFNNKFVQSTLKEGQEYFFSGKLGNRGVMIQPTFEAIKKDTIHTNRLVPLYTNTLDFKQGTLRRILKNICDNLQEDEDILVQLGQKHGIPVRSLAQSLKELHFPDEADHVIQARERLALEELIGLIKHSEKIKTQWKQTRQALSISLPPDLAELPPTIPFSLTPSQLRSAREILAQIQQTTPMNRLLIGDVGSGKTIVAGLALRACISCHSHACLIAPTQILAEQHAKTLHTFFPDLPLAIITGKGLSVLKDGTLESTKDPLTTPHLIVGTHAILNWLQKPQSHPVGLIVFDEQHRFGVNQRSELQHLDPHPHILTMTATPIPRSLMLTIFSHLSLSTIDELPKNRIPTKTWILPESKRANLYQWIQEQMSEQPDFLTLIVCPFIETSTQESLTNVAAATQMYEQIQAEFPANTQIELLHGRLKQKQKDQLLQQLFNHEIKILVTTPIVEVGIDLPQASVIVIEAAERFGLASLHQLRGRVGRAGQQGYCALFQTKGNTGSKKRLKLFEQTLNGLELAEADLQNRGAGDLFGTAQHGFDELRFASWTNVELIGQAQRLAKLLPSSWQPTLVWRTDSDSVPLAN